MCKTCGNPNPVPRDEEEWCPHCGCENCECAPIPKCTDCGGSGITIEGWTCDFCEGIGELDI
jgi:hypothetical protein